MIALQTESSTVSHAAHTSEVDIGGPKTRKSLKNPILACHISQRGPHAGRQKQPKPTGPVTLCLSKPLDLGYKIVNKQYHKCRHPPFCGTYAGSRIWLGALTIGWKQQTWHANVAICTIHPTLVSSHHMSSPPLPASLHRDASHFVVPRPHEQQKTAKSGPAVMMPSVFL